jgi:hypothetical protein
MLLGSSFGGSGAVTVRGESGKPPDLTDLLPDNWLKSHPQHRWEIDDIRQKERARSRQQKISKRKRR